MNAADPAQSVAWIATVWPPLVGAALMALSGLPGLFLGSRGGIGERLSVGVHLVGAGLALAGAACTLGEGAGASVRMAWGLPFGSFRIAVDGLSALFLVPLVIVPAVGSVYGLRSWSRVDHPATAPRLRAFYGTLAASLVMLTIARDGVLFLLAWEGMALSAYFLVVIDDRDAEAREAGWVYLVAAHLGTLAICGCMALVASCSGSFGLDPLAEASTPIGAATCIFLLALLGFGLKAGIMPLHVWLPGAHAAAPSHVYAVLSGVVLKAGIYGLARITGMLPDPPAFWGVVLLVLGAGSGVVGVAMAIGQHDLKRLLAYHSVENIGIFVMGLWLAMLGRSLGRPEWVALGFGGAMLHVWNHAYFKSLLFLAAGSAVHRTHTREMDRMGGLAHTMPATSLLFLCGAVAICGLPPLNGFVSELLICIGLLHTLEPGGTPGAAVIALGVPVLALIGARALACFAKAFGVTFLGTARGGQTGPARESPPAMLGPMVLLAALCIGIGLVPAGAAPFLDRATRAWSAGATPPALGTLAPFRGVTWLAAGVWALGLGSLVLLRRRVRAGLAGRPGTWDCGYAAPDARSQYSSSSFGQMLVSLFRWALRPHEASPDLQSPFPRAGSYRSHVGDVVLDSWVLPLVRHAARGAMRLRRVQAGRIQLYILYILLTVAAMMLSIVPVVDLLRSIVTR